MADTAASGSVTATASAAEPRAAAIAVSYPLRTDSSAATEPSRPDTWSVAASSAPAPSRRLRPISRASMRAASDDRSRSACCTSSRAFSSRAVMSSSRATADSCSASRPSSPASRPATLVSRAVKSRWARSTRATASCRASRSRPISSSAAAARVRSALTWPCSRARPSRRSAAARTSPATRRSSSAAASSAVRRPVTVSSSAARWVSTSAPMACSCSRTCAASASSRSGSRPESVGSDSTDAALRSRSVARDWVPRSRSRRPDSPNQVSWACDRAGRSSRREVSSAVSRSFDAASCASTSSRRSTRIVSSAISCSSAVRAFTRSSAISRARASRTSAWTVAAWRATSAWRPSGLS